MKAKKMIVATVLLLAILVAFVGCAEATQLAVSGTYRWSDYYYLTLNTDGTVKIVDSSTTYTGTYTLSSTTSYGYILELNYKNDSTNKETTRTVAWYTNKSGKPYVVMGNYSFYRTI